MQEPFCWKCGKKTEMPIGFRALCHHCGVDLHCCKNCRYYSPGKPNDCAVPGTDPIRDREARNFCEEFKVKLPGEKKEDPEKKKRDFHSLFGDS